MLTPDTVLQNRYSIVRRLGQGGMGTVYEAKALRLNTTVAIKETLFTDERLRKQFEREAQLLAGLRHPALPRVIDHFDEGDGLFLVMDFIEGEDLCDMLGRNGSGFPPDKVLEWADQILDALDYLHNQKSPIIHRDIKPQNLKLLNSGQIVLLDFGLAKGFAGQVSRATTTDSVYGFTPHYAPLEQIQGTGTDPRSDLYSLAATLYHLLTGNMPPDVLARLASTSDGQADPLRPANEMNPSVTPALAAALSKALSISRNQRFSNAAEMQRRLSEANRSRPPHIGDTGTVLPTRAAPLIRAGWQQTPQRILPPPAPARKAAKPTSTTTAPASAKPLVTPQSRRATAGHLLHLRNEIFGIAGSTLLIVGTLLPLVTHSSVKSGWQQSFGLLDGGQYTTRNGWILILLGIVGIIQAGRRSYKSLITFGVIALGIVVFNYLIMNTSLLKMVGQPSTEKLKQDGINVSTNWLSWSVLVLGALVLIVTGISGHNAQGGRAGSASRSASPPYSPVR